LPAYASYCARRPVIIVLTHIAVIAVIAAWCIFIGAAGFVLLELILMKGFAMIDRHDATLTFGVLICIGAAVTMAVSPMAWVGYLAGTVTTIAAAAIVNLLEELE
jgi:hypothetical protein